MVKTRSSLSRTFLVGDTWIYGFPENRQINLPHSVLNLILYQFNTYMYVTESSSSGGWSCSLREASFISYNNGEQNAGHFLYPC